MAGTGSYVVVDIGKTMSKVTLWSKAGALLDRKVRTNEVWTKDGLRRLDWRGIGDWLTESLSAYRNEPVEAIIPVAHGAGVVALRDGEPCIDPLDYEQPIPADIMADYRQERAPFSETGSPALPDGLNFGAQLFFLDRIDRHALSGATLLPWAQYWAWFLSGVATSEVTSLGCHSDLWNPSRQAFSSLARRMGWDRQFAPMAGAADAIGTLRPELAARTGLSPNVRIHAGLHDSNAALLAARGFSEIADNEATVLSTGTWFIAMRLTQEPVDTARLPEARDCLVNVDAFGRPVPSARFMGGREIETIIEIDTRRIDIKPDQPALLAAASAVLANEAMILPTLAQGCGPFPDRDHRWLNCPGDWYERRAAASLYAALVTDASLDLIGSKERLLVEGRFAEAQVFVRALAGLRPGMQVFTANEHNDVSFGALRLIEPSLKPNGALNPVQPLAMDLETYRDAWRRHLENRT